ncbi:glycerol-3-phosphate dehydrogenase [Tropicimonas sp. IMCC34011]|uniref:glycerol-3-phosphate dehydrogenase n=1 Tax=Tropicimonas sp. IMCC34011 TaxID=2248759 RepID=UPI000E24896C|nr:glycerol-3-phosphate dehydrogenase [Tropicimonas sp. IMCC34011]
MDSTDISDLFVIGGGINGCGIARDAAGRGLTVRLAEMNDLASATSSASTKLFHGGLRYLEYFEFRLVREALIERETLLRAMPHISWPLRFVLPYTADMRFESDTPTSKLMGVVMPWMKGRRPSWLIRMGLAMYDNLGGRKILKGTSTVNLRSDIAGLPLKERFDKAYEYSDCWVQDSRLVALNARDAAERGAKIMTRTKVIEAKRGDGVWEITTDGPEGKQTFRARALVNAGGPWVEQVINQRIHDNTREGVRLVKGSHIVTRKLFEHDKCYFFQGTDGRIIFAIPYEEDFTLIGTTDAVHEDPDQKPEISDEERDYLLAFVSQYFREPVRQEDIVWTYSGVRPLYDDGAKSATAATRDYVIKLHSESGAPYINIFGGKITTYRRLAESALERLGEVHDMGAPWTAGVPLPGGDFPVDGVDKLIADLVARYDFLGERWARRLVRAYGMDVWKILGEASEVGDLGQDFGHTLTETEVRWLMKYEFALTADDVLWRRGKLGLRLSQEEAGRLDAFMADNADRLEAAE